MPETTPAKPLLVTSELSHAAGTVRLSPRNADQFRLESECDIMSLKRSELPMLDAVVARAMGRPLGGPLSRAIECAIGVLEGSVTPAQVAERFGYDVEDGNLEKFAANLLRGWVE